MIFEIRNILKFGRAVEKYHLAWVEHCREHFFSVEHCGNISCLGRAQLSTFFSVELGRNILSFGRGGRIISKFGRDGRNKPAFGRDRPTYSEHLHPGFLSQQT